MAASPPLADRTGTAVRAGRLSALVSAPSSTGLPLAGVRIALDPGHQLGNHNFPAQISRPVPAGGFDKPCNTTGTRTNGGYPEATLNFRVARLVQARLEALGAEVMLTRTSNSQSLWGPCVDARGEFGARVGAQLTVSLHGDGAPSGAHGFHVIAPRERSPWTTDIATQSLELARALRSGFDALDIPRSTYVGGGTALSIRSDLGTLNLSDVPVAMLEVGNMRNASDAHRMTTRTGRARYARAVVRGIRLYLSR
jgi:N-acetylmuramoyl-L-alanine amidase